MPSLRDTLDITLNNQIYTGKTNFDYIYLVAPSIANISCPDCDRNIAEAGIFSAFNGIQLFEAEKTVAGPHRYLKMRVHNVYMTPSLKCHFFQHDPPEPLIKGYERMSIDFNVLTDDGTSMSDRKGQFFKTMDLKCRLPLHPYGKVFVMLTYNDKRELFWGNGKLFSPKLCRDSGTADYCESNTSAVVQYIPCKAGWVHETYHEPCYPCKPGTYSEQPRAGDKNRNARKCSEIVRFGMSPLLRIDLKFTD